MKFIFLLILFVGSHRLYAQPTADEFESFLGFSEKCPVSVQDIEPKKDGEFGEIVWLKTYVPAGSLYRYLIGVSRKGTLLKADRAQIEQDVRNRPRDIRRMGPESFLYKEVIYDGPRR